MSKNRLMNIPPLNQGKHIEFSLESSPDTINTVEHIIESLYQKLKFREDVYGNIMIAITEAVNNAIYHGNKQDESKKIQLQFDLPKPFLLAVTVKDEGEGFDVNNLPDPLAPENIAKPGGRGIFLMKNLADEVSFHNKGREIVMKFDI